MVTNPAMMTANKITTARESSRLRGSVPACYAGWRLDRVLSAMFPDFSSSP